MECVHVYHLNSFMTLYFPVFAFKGVVVAFFQASCLSAFTMFVATQADPATTILLIPGVYAFTALSSACSERVRRKLGCHVYGNKPPRNGQDNPTGCPTPNTKNSPWKAVRKKLTIFLDSKIAKLIALVLQIVGLLAATLALCSYPFRPDGPKDLYKSTRFVLVSIPICVLFLSFLWSPMVQSAIFKSECKNAEQLNTEQECESRPAYPGSYKGGMYYINACYLEACM